MKFEEAMWVLRNGGKVFRTNWVDKIKAKPLEWQDIIKMNFVATAFDLIADDWEISDNASPEFPMTIQKLVDDAHCNAVEKGFWEGVNDTLEYRNSVLMLIVSELGEACEALRTGNRSNFREELADVAIRLADCCGEWGIDLEHEIKRKMLKNSERPYKHGKKF